MASKKSSGLGMAIFPLLTIGLAIYAALTLSGVSASDGVPWHDALLLELPMYSGDAWRISWGDAFLLANMGLLFVELIRSTKTDTASITNHLLSILLFIAGLLLFILMPGFGNSTFFLFLAMTFLDPMAGLVVTTVTARRDLSVTDGIKA